MAIKKNKVDNKEGMEYEESGNIFNFHQEEQGSAIVDWLEYIGNILLNSLRQSCKAVVRYFGSHGMIYGLMIFLLSVWLSGWFAHASRAFESLLVIVIGFIIVVAIAIRSSK